MALALRPKFFGPGIEAQLLGLGLATRPWPCYLKTCPLDVPGRGIAPCGFVNITVNIASSITDIFKVLIAFSSILLKMNTVKSSSQAIELGEPW